MSESDNQIKALIKIVKSQNETNEHMGTAYDLLKQRVEICEKRISKVATLVLHALKKGQDD